MGNGITDAGLQRLQGLTQLESRQLMGNGITDAGLQHLQGLTELGRLGLSDTQVTDEGVAELKKSLPNCEIKFCECSK